MRIINSYVAFRHSLAPAGSLLLAAWPKVALEKLCSGLHSAILRVGSLLVQLEYRRCRLAGLIFRNWRPRSVTLKVAHRAYR